MGRFSALKTTAAVFLAVFGVHAQINWSANNITITTVVELAQFRDRVNINGDIFYGKTVTLGNDIDFEKAMVCPLNASDMKSFVPLSFANPFLIVSHKSIKNTSKFV